MSAIFLRVAVPALQFLVEILTNVVVWIKQNQTFTLTFIDLAIDNLDWLKEKFIQFIGWAQELWTTVKGWFGFGDENAKNIEAATKYLKPIEPSLALSPAATAKANTINTDTSLNISHLTVTTQATDAPGIANSIGGALNMELLRNIAITARTKN